MNRCNIGKIGIGLVFCVLSGIACADLPKPTATIEARATIVRGCQLSNIEQMLSFNKQAAMTQSKVEAHIENTSQSWSIRCTANTPVSIKLNNGENFLNDHWRMKHQTKDEYIPYLFFQDSGEQFEYKAGEAVNLSATNEQQAILRFSFFALVDLNNGNQARSAGIYKDSVAITIAW